MPRLPEEKKSYLAKVIDLFIPSNLIKFLLGWGSLLTIANLAARQPDVVVNKAGEALFAGAHIAKDIASETIKGLSAAAAYISGTLNQLFWGTTDTIKGNLLQYVAPGTKDFSFLDALLHPYVALYNVASEIHKWNVAKVDLIPYLIPRQLRDDTLLDRFFGYVLSDVYKGRLGLVNAMNQTKIFTNQWVYDQTVSRMVEVNSTYSATDNLLIHIKLTLVAIVVLATVAALVFALRILAGTFFNLLEALYKRVCLLVYPGDKRVSRSTKTTQSLYSESKDTSETQTNRQTTLPVYTTPYW